VTGVAVSVAFQTDKAPGDYARLALQAEQLGFDGVSVFHDLGYQPSLFALLEMAQATARVRLGAACLNPFLLHPFEIAGQVAALDLASDGRAYLGLARGAWLGDVGVRSERPLQRLTEAIEVVQRLLRGDESPYTGEVFSITEGMRLKYEPRRDRVDLLLGTWGSRGLALAGRRAEEVKLGGCANPDMVRHARRLLDTACVAAGREPSAIAASRLSARGVPARARTSPASALGRTGPGTSSAADSSSSVTRRRATVSPAPSGVRDSPMSPLVAMTSTTRAPASARRRSVMPVKIDSSSGWACRARTV